MKRFAALLLSLSLALFPVAALAQAQLQNPVIIGFPKGAGGTPALTSCGTSPTIVGNNFNGRLVTGSGATTCTITFSAAWTPRAPACVVSAEVATQPTWTVSTTAITFATSIASTAYHYHCVGTQ